MQVYQDAKCYLKGIFNAIEAFCSDQDSHGWRVEASIESAALLEYSEVRSLESPFDLAGEYPLETKVTSELLLHAKALQELFEGEQPQLMWLSGRPTLYVAKVGGSVPVKCQR